MTTTFLITAGGARAFPRREAAEDASGAGGHLIDSAEALAGSPLTATELVALYNALAGVTAVRKFTDRATAVRRVFAALQSVPVEETAEPAPVAHSGPTEGETPVPATETPTEPEGAPRAPATRSRADSKQAQVVAMLKRPKGATIDQIRDATGWQAHTVRGALAGALKKKLGLTIVSEKPEGGPRVYRIPA